MADTRAWIDAVRESHQRLAALLAPLSADQVTRRSYDDDWTIADVASHLGSQAEIFGLFLDAGLSGQDPPGGEAFGPIWDRWNALPPAEQVAASLAANAEFVGRLDALSEDEANAFSLALFGAQLDLGALLGMRLGEHAMHTWDVAVALDPTAQVAPAAVELLIDAVLDTASRVGVPTEQARAVVIETSAPSRDFVLSTGPQVQLSTGVGTATPDLELPAEAFLRLIYGRLDAQHSPADLRQDQLIDDLRSVFPGF